MPYLILSDYYSTIQDSTLQEILNGEDKYRLIKQAAALEDIKTLLSQKYDCSKEFRETLPFSYDDDYTVGQLVYLDADAYSASSTYELNDMVLSNGSVYYCVEAITVGEVFDGAKWELLGEQYTLFYVHPPKNPFNYKTLYNKYDEVFYKDKIYIALKGSSVLGSTDAIQYREYDELPYANQFPDAPGQSQWREYKEYSVTETWPTDTESYTEGDNRNEQLVEMNVMMAIYKLSPRISPNNVPDVWVKNYDDCMRKLRGFAKGEGTLDMPLLQPDSGGRIRWGSSVKNQNNY